LATYMSLPLLKILALAFDLAKFAGSVSPRRCLYHQHMVLSSFVSSASLALHLLELCQPVACLVAQHYFPPHLLFNLHLLNAA
jgi:hypothetical protein